MTHSLIPLLAYRLIPFSTFTYKLGVPLQVALSAISFFSLLCKKGGVYPEGAEGLLPLTQNIITIYDF
ncbi:MAG: hypothetical protein CVU08_06135 [Bacteroidetes bacterium HGW-Bacteroidetes-3]|nr:MAG: hypothetical protein CVU08_06135 [Bacteroidetes bacterium HGW-Bacteroidetes-3]